MALEQISGHAKARLTFVPAIEPPPGIESNPENPASLARYAHVTTAVCLPIITAFFLLRTYVRVYIKRTWIFEDCELFIAPH